MIESNFASSTQLSFKSTYFFINHLNSLIHGIFSAFEANTSLEISGVFLDLSKAFDRV